VLYSNQSDREWPYYLDSATGLFTYYGDNKTPGSELLDTMRGGNKLLADVFGRVHSSPTRRVEVPPFFVFTKAPTYGNRAVRFRGLAAPGANGVAPTDDLVAVWKSSHGQRFQNYKALFTVLETPRVPRAWLNDLYSGDTAPLVYQIPGSRHAYIRLLDLYAGVMPKTVWPDHLVVLNIGPLLIPTTGEGQTSELVSVAHADFPQTGNDYLLRDLVFREGRRIRKPKQYPLDLVWRHHNVDPL
jgi:hypothetical protein